MRAEEAVLVVEYWSEDGVETEVFGFPSASTREECTAKAARLFWQDVRTEREESVIGIDNDKTTWDSEEGYGEICYRNGDKTVYDISFVSNIDDVLTKRKQ